MGGLTGDETVAPTIIDALACWNTWHADISPLGSTGEYALDMRLADAFRALLYRPSLSDRLDWITRETQKPRRSATDDDYHAEIIGWWLDLWDAGKWPAIEQRSTERNRLCALS